MRGQCPAPGEAGVTYLAVLDGQVSLRVEWEWDGASVYPYCDGPITRVEAINHTDLDVVFHLPRAGKAAGREYTLGAGQEFVTTAPGTFRQLGYETITDMGDLTISAVT